MKVATRLAWSFIALFAVGLLLISAFVYYELVLEPVNKTHVQEPIWITVIELVAEASIPLALLALSGWWLARRALYPVEELAAAADRIHEGNLKEPIVMRGSGAEFERLALVFNAMTARLDASFQRVRQFTLYASHELKTPLSILRAEFERLVDDASRSEADRHLFARHLDEMERLAQMVDGLTFLTKADAQLVPLTRERVALKPLMMSAAEDMEVLGTEQKIAVMLERCDDVTMDGDRHRLRQLLVILCDNAVKYNRPQGTVQMRLEQTSEDILLSIRNSGPGIPAREQSRVFDRFYRGSSVKSDSIEGCGLGLSIAQWIVHAHGGTLNFTSEPENTWFTVSFPLKQLA
ncbi:hypothetical protein BH11VER1_BH11VER1_06050 [soil metagenome]